MVSYVLTNRSKDESNSVAKVETQSIVKTQSIVDTDEMLAAQVVPEEANRPVEANTSPVPVDVGTVSTEVAMAQIALWPEPEPAAVEARVVGQGDGIWQMCRAVYGTVDAHLVRVVLDSNPHIENPNELTVGETLVFPSMAMIRYD